MDRLITHTFLLRYVYFSHDAVLIGMKQQRLVMLYLSAIEQKKNEVTTVIALILNYVTILWLILYYELRHLKK